MQEGFSMALSSLKQLQTHGQENKSNNNFLKKEAFLLAFSKQEVVVCKAQASKTTDVKN